MNLPSTPQRKQAHLDLCLSDEVDFHEKTSLLEQVQLIHQALPERHLDDVRVETFLLGKTLRAPLIISGMTGGTPRAQAINADLARAAETLGLGFGLGSQRAMLEDPSLSDTYCVRDVAPHTLILANIGLTQANRLPVAQLQHMVAAVGADALCVHVNPAMEVIQPEGDLDFRGGLATLKRIQNELAVPLVVKETGCGLSYQTGAQLRTLGITHVDVGGAGGTSWVGVETQRAPATRQPIGQTLWDWGIPTAASVAWMQALGFSTVVATGGIRTGLDVARALALGAHAAGMAAPVLRAHAAGGYEGVLLFLQQCVATLQRVVFLTGCASASALRQAPKVLGASLQNWISAGRP